MSNPFPDHFSQRARFPIWPGIFTLVALEGLAMAIYLSALPADPGGRFLGYSAYRLLLIGLLLGGALAFAFLAWRSRRPAWRGPETRRGWVIALFVLLPLVALASLLAPLTLLNLYRASEKFHYLAYYQRLLPLFAWAFLASLEIFTGVCRAGLLHWQALKQQRSVFRAGLVIWALFGLLGLIVALTGIGVAPDRVGWGPPTVSLMEWQIWLAWAAGILLLLWLAVRSTTAGSLSNARGKWNVRFDGLLAAAIWLLAVTIWLGQPIRPAFFATAGRAPNYEIYPFSDGAYYGHFAQSALIGDGFKGGEIPARPFYVSLLAVFHLVGGQKYENVIAVQTLLLAFFPVILFFLGKALHSRPAGLVVALLAIFRELTAIIAMPITDNASNSKLFFADLPAATAVSLWVLLAVLWLKSQRPGGRDRPILPFLVGGGLGLAMLFRTQSMFMLPAVLLLAFFMCYVRPASKSGSTIGSGKARPFWPTAWLETKGFGAWLRGIALIVLGLTLTLAPWLARNFAISGRLAFDDDKSQTGSMAQRYSFSGYDETYIYQPGEDPQAYSARVTQGIFGFLRAHPDVVAGFVSAHWINAEIDNLLVLPVRGGIQDPRELTMPLSPIWQAWDGHLSPWQAALFAVNLGLVALGIGACWVRLGWPGLALLLVSLSYHFSNALARNSGGRYLLVVDWALYAYAAVGLMEIAIAVLTVVGLPPERLAQVLTGKVEPAGERLDRETMHTPRKQWLAGAFIGLGFLLLGSLPVLVERAIPARYPEESRSALIAEALNSPALLRSSLDRSALERFTAQSDVVVVKGRALYPRYYGSGEGEPRTAKTGYEPLDYARTVFLIASKPYNGLSILKMQGAPEFFPNAADVIVIGCPGYYLDARLVVVLNSQIGAYTAGDGFPEHCPASEQQAQ